MVDTLLFCFQGHIEGCSGVHTVGVSIYTAHTAKYLGINLTDQLSYYKFVLFFNKWLTLLRCHCSVFIVCPWSGQLHKHVSWFMWLLIITAFIIIYSLTQFLIIRSQWRLPNKFSLPAACIFRGRHWDVLQHLWCLIWFNWPFWCPCFCCCQSALSGFQTVAWGVSIGRWM